LIERLDDERVFLPLVWIYQWRQDLQVLIDKMFSPDTAGVLDAALLGNRYNLLPATAERFRAGGTFHVLVISGLHISFIGGLVYLLSQRLTRRRWLQFLLSTTVLWGYTIGVGAEASVVRAALMFTIVALALVIFRPASLATAESLRSFISTDFPFRAGDHHRRVAADAETQGNRILAANTRNSISALLPTLAAYAQ
jgi:predicted membrane metal-binding protein